MSGSVTGLQGGTLKLQNNTADTLTLLQDGNFSFPSAPAGSNYDVSVIAQPAGMQCTVSNASGSLSANVSNVSVSCISTPFYTLHAFNGNDGARPKVALVIDSAGNLFGTTPSGGSSDKGTVFKLARNTDGSYASATTLYSFTGVGSDGDEPRAALVLDGAGNLIGTTRLGGSSGKGTVFKLARNSDGTYAPASTLHSFTGAGSDGDGPLAALAINSAGNLFGTTQYGGSSDKGTVFKLVRNTDGSYAPVTTLHSFTGSVDGEYPQSALVLDSAGNLFGTADGGSSNGGVVFKLARNADGSYASATVLDSFNGGIAATGAGSLQGSVVLDNAGNLFGTSSGGSNSKGAIFKLARNSDGSYKPAAVLYSFTGGMDGNFPQAGLVLDSAGNLFGTTQLGGNGFGTAFKLARNTDDTYAPAVTLYAFIGANLDGAAGSGVSTLVLDSAGNLLGTADCGGSSSAGFGMVFKIQN